MTIKGHNEQAIVDKTPHKMYQKSLIDKVSLILARVNNETARIGQHKSTDDARKRAYSICI